MRLRRSARVLTPLVLALSMAACGGPSETEYVTSARELVQKRDFKAATIQLKSAIQLNPQGAEARFLYGKLLQETGDAAAAMVELRKAAELGYDENQLIPPLASAMVQQGEAKQVVEQFAGKNLANAEGRALSLIHI